MGNSRNELIDDSIFDELPSLNSLVSNAVFHSNVTLSSLTKPAPVPNNTVSTSRQTKNVHPISTHTTLHKKMTAQRKKPRLDDSKTVEPIPPVSIHTPITSPQPRLNLLPAIHEIFLISLRAAFSTGNLTYIDATWKKASEAQRDYFLGRRNSDYPTQISQLELFKNIDAVLASKSIDYITIMFSQIGFDLTESYISSRDVEHIPLLQIACDTASSGLLPALPINGAIVIMSLLKLDKLGKPHRLKCNPELLARQKAELEKQNAHCDELAYKSREPTTRLRR